jgi:hypothetical protein
MGAEALPDVPAAADLVSGYEAGSWFGIGAPKATASSVIRQLKTPLLSRRGFLLGACREHPRGMPKEAARGSRYLWRFSATWLALPSATAAEFLSCSNGSAHARAVGLP